MKPGRRSLDSALEATTQLARSAVPKLGLAQTLTLVQVIRVVGASFLIAMAQGLFQASFAIPAGVGDILVAVTAPLAVFALRRGSLLGWVGAIVWNVLGITDLAVAVTEGQILGASHLNTPVSVGFPWILIPTIGVPTFIALHLVTLTILLRQPLRAYFVAGEVHAHSSSPLAHESYPKI